MVRCMVCKDSPLCEFIPKGDYFRCYFCGWTLLLTPPTPHPNKLLKRLAKYRWPKHCTQALTDFDYEKALGWERVAEIDAIVRKEGRR